ncbi:MAG: hypothetical protein GC185_13945 [Alphaproteobacteria bacterium]|nr:hypothetical protein [Alphaproteobacteria bacterium]
MASNLAKLVVSLEAETARYQKELESARRKLDSFDKRATDAAKKVGIALGVAVSAAAAAGTAIAKSTIDAADEMAKMSQQVGISTEALSQYKYAADLSGVAFDQFTAGLKKFARTASDAASGVAESKEAFDGLGINVQNADGTLKGIDGLLLEVADKFATLEDGTAKAAVAQELFGRSGASLIPLLNEGSQGIEALRAEAAGLGITLDAKTAKAAERFNDNMSRVKTAISGAALQLIERLLPSMVALTDRFIDSLKEGGRFKDFASGLSVVLRSASTAAITVYNGLQLVGQGLALVAGAAVLAARGDFSKIGPFVEDMFNRMKTTVAAATDDIKAVWSDTVGDIADATDEADKKLRKSIVVGDGEGSGGGSAVEKSLAQLQQLEDQLRQSVDTFGQGEAAVISYRLAHGDLAAAVAATGAAGAATADKIRELAAQQEALKAGVDAAAAAERDQARAAEIIRDSMSDSERAVSDYNTAIAEMTRLAGEGYLSQDQLAAGVAKARAELEKAPDAAKTASEGASDAADVIGTAFEDAVLEGKKLSDIVDGVLKDIARIVLRETVTKPLENAISSGVSGAQGALSGIASSIFGGARAEGGPVKTGKAYLVGENGPEFFMPGQSGSIAPTAAPSQTNLNVSVVVPQGMDPRGFRQASGGLSASIVRELARAEARYA